MLHKNSGGFRTRCLLAIPLNVVKAGLDRLIEGAVATKTVVVAWVTNISSRRLHNAKVNVSALFKEVDNKLALARKCTWAGRRSPRRVVLVKDVSKFRLQPARAKRLLTSLSIFIDLPEGFIALSLAFALEKVK